MSRRAAARFIYDDIEGMFGTGAVQPEVKLWNAVILRSIADAVGPDDKPAKFRVLTHFQGVNVNPNTTRPKEYALDFIFAPSTETAPSWFDQVLEMAYPHPEGMREKIQNWVRANDGADFRFSGRVAGNIKKSA